MFCINPPPPPLQRKFKNWSKVIKILNSPLDGDNAFTELFGIQNPLTTRGVTT